MLHTFCRCKGKIKSIVYHPTEQCRQHKCYMYMYICSIQSESNNIRLNQQVSHSHQVKTFIKMSDVSDHCFAKFGTPQTVPTLNNGVVKYTVRK